MSSWYIMLRTEWRKPEVRVLIRAKSPPAELILTNSSKRFLQSKELEMLQSAKLRIISERQETRMNKTALQMCLRNGTKRSAVLTAKS